MDGPPDFSVHIAIVWFAIAVHLAIAQAGGRWWKANHERWQVRWRELMFGTTRRNLGSATRFRRRPPLCLEALGLDDTATPDQVLSAYRQLARDVHPDHGGNPKDFKRLQSNFEQALALSKSRHSQSLGKREPRPQ